MTRPGSAAPRFPFADRVRVVLFDAGNTLLWLDHERMATIVAPSLGPVTFARMRDAEMRARPLLDPFLRSAARREGSVTAQRYAETIVAGLTSERASAVTAVADLVAAWGTLWVSPPADAALALDTLAGRGFVVGCVSNSSGNVRSLLESAGLASRLACVIDSGIEGVEKPDPRIFLRAATMLNVAPAECVYVGDFVSLDIDGARGAGMHAVLVDPVGAWPADATDAPRVRSLSEVSERL
ncbi:MAG: HAD family hydrolase [Planctomycetes bacterium]|nr:HAD family hydrolase [Planctomycetota bacterium]